jgi:hypothetical protein
MQDGARAATRPLDAESRARGPAYSERWYRAWRSLLAWTVVVGEQVSTACLHVVLNKDVSSFDRGRVTARSSVA